MGAERLVGPGHIVRDRDIAALLIEDVAAAIEQGMALVHDPFDRLERDGAAERPDPLAVRAVDRHADRRDRPLVRAIGICDQRLMARAVSGEGIL